MDNTYVLDPAAVAAFLMCFQKALAEEMDIRQLFAELKFVVVDGKLVVMNPPTFADLEEPEDPAVSTESARKIAESIELR